MNAVPPSLSVVGVVAASVIFVLGHALNIGLGIIAVLVHDIRLNTLEFSNHMGLQWTGIKYNPLKKQIKKEC